MTLIQRLRQSDELTVARVLVRRGRERLRTLRHRDKDLALSFGVLRAGRATARPLRSSDAGAWTEAMRGNGARMQPWWSAIDDWHAATDRLAFTDHLLRSREAARHGHGLTLALCEDDALVGEVAFYNMAPGDAHTEVGIWLRPEATATRDHALLCAAIAAWMFESNGMQDYDLYGLTAPRLAAARPLLGRLGAWPSAAAHGSHS